MANSAISTSKPKTCQDIAYYRDIDYEIMPARIAKIQKDFKNYTEKIRGPPHDPQHWIQRATWFLEKNRWPLLAAAEAYKVHKWFCCPRFRHELGLNRIPDSELKKMQSNAGKILVKALLELNDVVMAGYYCKLLDVPLAQEGRTKIDCLCLEDNKSTINPKMKSLQYPWLPGPFLDRKNYLQKTKEDLLSHDLELKPSKIGPRGPNNLGIFATRQFEQGEILFKEKTFRASSPSSKGSPITHFYDEAIKDLEEGTPQHLLNRSVLGALTASYSDVETTFRFDTYIRKDLHYLKNKDPKLLWNLDFDMWVLNTARQRCEVNQFELKQRDGDKKVPWAVISPMTSLFQHSCEPSVRWNEDNGNVDAMVVTAMKPIEKGEEIYDSYCDINEGLKERRDALRHWIGCDCRCTRCLREEKEKAEKDAQEADSGTEMNHSVTPSSRTVSSSEVDSGSDTSMGGTC